MDGDYEQRLSQAHRMFSNRETKAGLGFQQERRSQDRRQQDILDRRTLMDRRQQELVVEHERRKNDRRERERRSFVERRVTSNWSEERLQEERKKLQKEFDARLRFYVVAFWILAICSLLWMLSGCTTKVGCGNETTTFLGMEFHNPIAQKCADRPNRATDIVGF